MLKNRYQEIILGMGLMGLIRGLISIKRQHSILLIDDPRFLSNSYHTCYLSELEVQALIRLGKNNNIPELVNLRQFLLPGSLNIVTEEFRLFLGHTPFENLREVLRKFPELLDPSDLDLPYSEPSDSFNEYFLEELKRFELTCYETSKNSKALKFELQGPKWLKTLYSRFSSLINKEYASSKTLKYSSLIHLLSLSAEEKLKTHLAPEEVPFYFFRLLSPVYRLQDFFLTTQLKRRMMLEGGDFKESSIQYWQFHEGKFENLLLASFEGVISGDNVLFFAHIPADLPFSVQSNFPVFRKNQLTPSKKLPSPIPPTDLSLITHTGLLGSDTPYRVLGSSNGTPAFYHCPYPELSGSKAEFYENSMRTHFESDAQSLPFEDNPAEFKEIQEVTLDLRSIRETRKSMAPVLTRLPLEVIDGNTNIQGVEYWGPFRYRSFGLLSLCYGVER